MRSPNPLRLLVLLAVATTLVVGVGCSFSESSKSSSKSSASSSGSSKSKQARYRDDVSEYAQGYVKAGGGDATSFRTGLSKVAEKRGISDWETDPDTWKSLGAGLKQAKVSEPAFNGYVASWTGGDATRVEQMRKGFGK